MVRFPVSYATADRVRPALLVAFLVAHAPQCSQAQSLPTRAWADSVWQTLEQNRTRDAVRALELTGTMLSVYGRERDTCMMARTQAFRSLDFDQMGQLDSAMAAMQRSLGWFRPGCDSLGLMRAIHCQTNLYLSLGDFELVDSVATAGLALWNEDWGRSAVRNALLTNRAIARANRGDLPGALSAFREVLTVAIREGNDQDIDDAYTNLGVMKSMMGEPDSSCLLYTSRTTKETAV